LAGAKVVAMNWLDASALLGAVIRLSKCGSSAPPAVKNGSSAQTCQAIAHSGEARSAVAGSGNAG